MKVIELWYGCKILQEMCTSDFWLIFRTPLDGVPSLTLQLYLWELDILFSYVAYYGVTV